MRSRRSMSMYGSMKRLSLMIVMATLLVGQLSIMDELGIAGEHAELYQLAVLFLFVYMFGPQIQYVLQRLLDLVDRKWGEDHDI